MIYKHKNIVKNNLSIQEAIKKLDECYYKCLIVVDNKSNSLIGSITDGDIRRSILKGKDFKSSISNAVNTSLNFFYEGKYKKAALIKIMEKTINKIEIIPIVNLKKKVVKLLTLKDLKIKQNKNSNKFKVVIMAGGAGTRMQPFTDVLPKPLIPVKGKTIIEHIIYSFTKQDINEFIITLNYKSKLLRSYFEELSPTYKIDYTEEKTPLGTAGGLKQIKYNNTKYVLVTNCDTILNIDYNDLINFHIDNKSHLTIVACRKNYKIQYGNCEVTKKGKFIKISEKPNLKILVNTGVYVINTSQINRIKPKTKFDMTDLVKLIQKDDKVNIYPVDSKKWNDVGQWHEYRKTLNNLKD